MKIAIASIAAAVYLAAGASPAMAQSKAQIDSQCEVGTDKTVEKSGEWKNDFHPTAGGLTPKTMPGALRVSIEEIYCLKEKYPKLYLITPIDDEVIIENSHRIKDGWKPGSYQDEIQTTVATRLREITGGRKDAPLVSYCHNANCFMSWNLLLRARAAGYTNLYWFRDGKAAWGHRQARLFAEGWAEGQRKGEAILRNTAAIRCHPWADLRISQGSDVDYWRNFKAKSMAAARSDGMEQADLTRIHNDGVKFFQSKIGESRIMDADLGLKETDARSFTASTMKTLDKVCQEAAAKFR